MAPEAANQVQRKLERGPPPAVPPSFSTTTQISTTAAANFQRSQVSSYLSSGRAESCLQLPWPGCIPCGLSAPSAIGRFKFSLFHKRAVWKAALAPILESSSGWWQLLLCWGSLVPLGNCPAHLLASADAAAGAYPQILFPAPFSGFFQPVTPLHKEQALVPWSMV